MRILMVATIAFLAVVSPAWGKEKPVCKAPSAHLSIDHKQVAAVGGRCTSVVKVANKMVHKSLKVKFYFQYWQFDQGGNTCGTAASTGRGQTFKLKIKPYRLKIRFGLTRPGVSTKVWGKWSILNTGGHDVQCGGAPAPTNQLCAWQSVNDSSFTGACGEPIQNACSWAGPATMNDGLVSAGPVSCPTQPCTYLYTNSTKMWFTPTPLLAPYFLQCQGDGGPTGAEVSLHTIQLAHYDANNQLVVDCTAHPKGIAVTGFTIPSSWGGKGRVLMTEFWVFPVLNGHPVGQFESQTSIFPLSSKGTTSGCPLSAVNG